MRKQFITKRMNIGVVVCMLFSCCIGCKHKDQITAPNQEHTTDINQERENKKDEQKDYVNEELENTNVKNPKLEDSEAEDREVPQFIVPDGMNIKERFLVPEGFERVSIERGSFAEYLENFPLLEDGASVKLYDGSLKANQQVHAAVFDLPLVSGDLQQCADSVIRLYAQYFRETKQYDRMKIHFVNGFCCDYDKWIQGKRVKVSGDDVSWINSGEAGDSQAGFEQYLRIVFCYASTLSLEQESVKKEIKDIAAGDIFIKGGSPGHVVMVLDVCENEEGNRAFLLGQGYMPAQQFHVIKNPLHEQDPWYYVSELTEPFDTPEYTFEHAAICTPYTE